jgi:drug/metabolite transporter (DMT)-like permease
MSRASIVHTSPQTTELSRVFTMPVVFALGATWFVWGSTYFAIKLALVSLPPLLQMGSRFVVAGGLLLAFLLLRGKHLPTRLQWRNALLIGGLMLGGGMGSVGFAQQSISSGLAATMVAAMPVILAFWRFVLNRHMPKPLEALGIAMGVGGVLMLTRGQGLSASMTGTLAMLLAIICWSLGSVLSRERFMLADGAMGFASEMLAGGVLLCLASLVRGESLILPLQASAIAAWAYLVIAGSLIAFSSYMLLLDRVSPSLATSYCYVNPVVALAIGAAFGAERVTHWEMLSVAVILSAVALITAAQSGERRPE